MAKWIVTMEGPFVGTTEIRPVIYPDGTTEQQILDDWLDEAVSHYEQWLNQEDYDDEYYDESESSSNYWVEKYDPEKHKGTWLGDWLKC